MSVFGRHYARYYDLLYRDKDYRGEARFVRELIRRHAQEAQSLLELGCGTGRHAEQLVEMGCSVYGVDRSRTMLEDARKRAESLSREAQGRLRFAEGDIREIRLNEKFDAVISLFHVMSYQTTNADLVAAFETAKIHLRPGGLFVFDCWYGPAVLTDRPAVRVKRLEDEVIAVTRLTEPRLHPNSSCVDVCFTVFVKDKASGSTEEIKEDHRMRYLFQPELEALGNSMQLKLIDAQAWLTGGAPGFDTWNVCFVFRG